MENQDPRTAYIEGLGDAWKGLPSKVAQHKDAHPDEDPRAAYVLDIGGDSVPAVRLGDQIRIRMNDAASPGLSMGQALRICREQHKLQAGGAL